MSQGEYDEDIRSDLYEDYGLFELHREGFVEQINEILKEKGEDITLPYTWHVNASNIGWRNQSGEDVVEVEDWGDLKKLLPDTDMTIRVYDEGDGFRMVVSHHDSPTGESYSFEPAEPEFKKGDKVIIDPEFIANCNEEVVGVVVDVYFEDNWGEIAYFVNYFYKDGDEDSDEFPEDALQLSESTDKTSKRMSKKASGKRVGIRNKRAKFSDNLERDAGMRYKYQDLLVNILGAESVLDNLVMTLSDDEAIAAFDYIVQTQNIEQELLELIGEDGGL